MGILDEALVADRGWGRTSLRPRILAGLDHFDDVPETLGHGKALAEASARLRHRLQKDWGPAEMPDYAAIGH
ncbi:MAG: hypothetical protein ACO1SV_17120 [Fimbriimonas sp.]